MNRRNFLSLTGTFTGGMLILPEFLHAFGNQKTIEWHQNSCVVFIQLNGGNDGLNTFIPFENPLYYSLRPNINLAKDSIIGKTKGMGFHPALHSFAQIQQNGHLSIIQNVGYPEPNRSHFRSQEIWQTASASNQYLNEGWLGRYLDVQCKEHVPTAGINIDNIDNLALKGIEPNFITVKDPNRFKKKSENETSMLSNNPQLDFVRKIANSVSEGSDEIQKALSQSKTEITYPKTQLGKNLEWIARLIKGNLNSKVYYTSQNGYDTHDNQLAIHNTKLTELNDAIFSFYSEVKQANLLQQVTLVIFSEFGRRVKDNGNGTDHGTAAPLFIIGGNNKNSILGQNPNLENLDEGDLKYEIDFRSVYATILKNKLDFNPMDIGLKNAPLSNLF
ncbi:Twin-arginine translocation pathway signal sequence domain protein precusor [Flavobacterium indicum GPTSA100-9 = DSM 17447]|uniref:Twin-arginine translocation pathway signal sequence domain protein precusor n=1 Tax=Flavobacterium indicum (strain DSM 17447 / CIP 109464 / GPTSA100-9) TaxID=1094466 RepID=H8XVR1_FLAIG|nr:DUF1501 domain-containing protein [Flavobacterium indicum]CCG54025.1 Twin-arginine translocation pathway signal sequence domain protein precusor [Flavobacterium indicum GPTSA100-9 = DSM 17447]